MHRLKTLDNGIRIMTHPMANMESVAIGIWIRAGGRYEEPKTSGISHLLEHLLFKGTASRDMMTIKQEIEGRGGSFNGFTSEENTCYLVKVLGKDVELAVDDRDPSGVVPPVLEPLEALEQHRYDVAGSDCADDSTHRRLPFALH
jgi:secreted Zn-dependent insulinase-like peptidase